MERFCLFAEMSDRLLEGSRRYAKNARVGQTEFEDKKKGESDAGGAGRHRGDDKRVRFRKDPKSKEQRNRPKDQNEDQARAHGTASDLKGHQEPRSRDLISEGAHRCESLLLLFSCRRERAKKRLYSPPGRQRNGYGQAFRIDRLGTPKRVIGALDRLL